MADSNAIELIKRGDRRWAKRQQLDTYRHEIALNFSPIDAEWTESLTMGEDFAAHLIDGTPLLLARDYQQQVAAILRPPSKQWFWRRTSDENINNDPSNRDYLDWRSRQTMRIMYDRPTGIIEALDHTDRFYSLFGDGCASVDVDDLLQTLRINSYHTKDVVWVMGKDNKPKEIGQGGS